MKKLILILILSGICLEISSQIDHAKAHRRYWYYRTRLINDFMKIGKEQGECIVFAERNQDYTSFPTVYLQQRNLFCKINF